MAKGFCGNPKCGVKFTEDNTCQSSFKRGRGWCRACHTKRRAEEYKQNPEKYKQQSKKYRDANPAKTKAWDRSFWGRHRYLRVKMKEQGIPYTDLLWNFNFYVELIKDLECHYCLGSLNVSGSGLDRSNNNVGYTCFNVIPCCKMCNAIKSDYFSYDGMMQLVPIIRKIKSSKIGLIFKEC